MTSRSACECGKCCFFFFEYSCPEHRPRANSVLINSVCKQCAHKQCPLKGKHPYVCVHADNVTSTFRLHVTRRVSRRFLLVSH